MSAPEPQTLQTTFTRAEQSRLALSNHSTPPSSPSYQTLLTSSLQAYQTCLDLTDRLALFSPNETLEDLSTHALRYLLVPFRVAELSQTISTTTPEQRLFLVRSARSHYENFLSRLDAFEGILDPAQAKLLASYTEDPAHFSMTPSSDPTVRRNAKIANFRLEKELKQKLEYLRQSPRYATAEADDEAGDEGGDEEPVREVYLAELRLSAHLAFQGLEGINRELEILALAPSSNGNGTSVQTAQDDARRRGAGIDENYSDRLDSSALSDISASRPGPLLSKEGKPLRPFTLTARRDLQAGVFRPSHNLPTMSIDEYLEEERAQGGIIEGGGEASGRAKTPDEDDFDKADQETMKARAWDEFVEANPKGSGNTLNRG